MTRKPKITSLDDDSGTFLGGQRKVILKAAETAGDVYLVEGIMPEGSQVPTHIHEQEDEIFHVLTGRVELVLGEDIIAAKAGDIIYLPRGVKHGIRTLGVETARVLNYVIPGQNFEAFFEKMKAIGITASKEAKAAIAKEHGIRFL